jgi:acyl-CoA carboxylase subunit beta
VTALRTAVDVASPEHLANTEAMRAKLAEVETEHAKALIGGGEKYLARHHHRGKLLARERIELLLDPDSPFLELCPLAGWGSEFTVGAALVTGIGIALVESGGADLPTQKEVFIPGGRTFRDITRASAAGIPTIAIVFGNSTRGTMGSHWCRPRPPRSSSTSKACDARSGSAATPGQSSSTRRSAR